MSNKLGKSSYPAGHGPNDFQCFGPPALEDGNFDTCKIADMGSFSQEEKDSNKYYHAAVVKSKTNGLFYTYFEWGRVGASSPQFQMIECASEAEAQREFAAQCHEKNDKRGVWSTVAGLRTLTAKPGKDVYLVRQLTTRSTGLPDAKTIKYIDPNTPKKPDPKASGAAGVKSSAKKADPHTSRLLQDLIGGTIKYTRSAMADDSLPTQSAIDQARTILTEAQKRVGSVGDDLDDQINDKELRVFSSELYRRIPKVKAVGTPDSVWILSGNNILSWQQDLDAFESALTGQAQVETDSETDPFHGLPLHMEWIDPKSDLGKFLTFWWPKATANRHGHIGQMKIKNLWKVDRHGDDEKFTKMQDKIYAELGGAKISERPLFQPNERHDVDPKRREVFSASNTALLFHGTRTVNVKGILEKSLLLPKQLVGVAINGAMFGPGLYWADDWKKSAGYTSLRGSIWSGGGGSVSGRAAFMFAADVTVGEPHVAPGPRGYTAPPKGTHCIFGMGRNHGKKQYSGVENNEWIVFQNAQSRLKYLCEFET
jgi:predicted DNA-binding WGR domain protein